MKNKHVDDDQLICPHCKSVFEDSEAYLDQDYSGVYYEIICHSCEKEFLGAMHVKVTYSSKKMGNKHVDDGFECVEIYDSINESDSLNSIIELVDAVSEGARIELFKYFKIRYRSRQYFLVNEYR